jgi:hypothetical protein
LSLEFDVPFESNEGYQYIVSFTEFQSVPKTYKLPLVSISIALVSSDIETNSLKTLNIFIEIVLKYVEQNDVLLYFICDTAPIKMRENRKVKFSSQEFRFTLFLAMFTKLKSEIFYLQPVVLTDKIGGNHYTALISRLSHQEEIELVKSDLEEFNSNK